PTHARRARAGPHRPRGLAPCERLVGAAARAWPPALRARRRGDAAGRHRAALELSPEPAEHADRQAHASDVACGLRAVAPARPACRVAVLDWPACCAMLA